MAFSAFVNFDGNGRQALDFYADVFGVSPGRLMTFGDAPDTDVAEADRDRILFASLSVAGTELMLSDCPSGFPLVRGNGLALVVSTADKAELRRLYERLLEGGTVHMPLEQTFFSELFAHLEDKFGILWQLSHDAAAA